MTDSEWTPPEVVPVEGETYMQAYERVLKEQAGIVEEDEKTDAEVLGVLTGQVPVRSMPVATSGRRSGKTSAAEQWLAEQEDEPASE